MVVAFQIYAYFYELFYICTCNNNRVLFRCLQTLILTLAGLGEFSKVMQTRDVVKGLHNCLEVSQPSSCLDEAM